MKTLSVVAGALLALGVFGAPASAAPLSAPGTALEVDSLVDQVQYRRNCIWTGTSWGYKSGTKVLVCKPYRPAGRGWIWHNEGPRHGWYHSQRKSWHHNKW